jgi:hypothetical protein
VNDMVLYPDDSPAKQKKCRLGAPLHPEIVAPLSLLTDAVNKFDSFFKRDGKAATLFGLGFCSVRLCGPFGHHHWFDR